MDKLYAIKIRQSDGTYGAAIPVSVLAENVDWNSTLSLVDILGQVDTSESIQDQINSLKNTKATQASVNALDQKVDNAVEYITHNSEIADAREGVDGTEYSTLKERLDTEYDILQSQNASSLVMVNEDPEDTTKVNIMTTENEIELALQSDLDAAEEETTYLKNVITSDGVWVFIGDSFFTNNYNPATKIASFLGKTYGTDIIVTAKGGAGFSHPADDIVFLTLLQNLTVPDNNAVTKVFFCGGTNDIFSGTQTTLLGAVQTACKQAHVKFPYAEVYVVNTESWINDNYTWTLRDSLNRYYQQGAARGGAKYLGAVGVECKLYASSMLNDDLIHPTDTGYQSIAQQILVNMSGLGYSEGYGITNVNIGFKMEDDKIYVRWYSNYTAVLASTIASLVPNSANEIDIPITNCVIKQNSDTKDFFDTYGAVKVNGSFIPCRLKGQFTFTGIKVFPWLVEGSGSPTWTNITQVIIPAGTTAILTAHCTM